MDKEKGFITLTGFLSVAKPAAADANSGAATIIAEVDANTISGYTTAAGGALTIAAQPDYPRNMILWITDANSTVTGGTVTVTGQDQNGDPIEEDFTIPGTGSGSVTGTKAFSYVRGALIKSVTGTAGAGDKVALGTGAAFGCPGAPNCKYIRDIKSTFDGADEAGTFSKTYGLYTPAGTPNGAKAIEVLYLYKIAFID